MSTEEESFRIDGERFLQTGCQWRRSVVKIWGQGHSVYGR